jgi:ribosomal protein S18 acetylase RimI-like enzyme
MITSEWSDWRDGLFWWIQSVYVTPEQRGQGIYRALYAEVLALARAERGICGLRLYVEKDNQSAQKVYRSLSMEDTGYLVFEELL